MSAGAVKQIQIR